MRVGSFGPLVFQVSDREVFTLQDFKRRRSAQFAEHAVVDGLAKLQHLGTTLADVSFVVRLDQAFTDILARLNEVDAMIDGGEHHALVVSGRRLGRFVLLECSEAGRRLAAGRPLFVELELKLKEYN